VSVIREVVEQVAVVGGDEVVEARRDGRGALIAAGVSELRTGLRLADRRRARSLRDSGEVPGQPRRGVVDGQDDQVRLRERGEWETQHTAERERSRASSSAIARSLRIHSTANSRWAAGGGTASLESIRAAVSTPPTSTTLIEAETNCRSPSSSTLEPRVIGREKHSDRSDVGRCADASERRSGDVPCPRLVTHGPIARAPSVSTAPGLI